MRNYLSLLPARLRRKEGRKPKPEIRRAAVRRISSIAYIDAFLSYYIDGEMMKVAPTLIASASSVALSSSASAPAPVITSTTSTDLVKSMDKGRIAPKFDRLRFIETLVTAHRLDLGDGKSLNLKSVQNQNFVNNASSILDQYASIS